MDSGLLCRSRGNYSRLEPARAIAYLKTLGRSLKPRDLVIVCLSGRGDKDSRVCIIAGVAQSMTNRIDSTLRASNVPGKA